MSEPVSNVEIEDVLSSIRKLVSNTEREERPEPEEASDDAGKLVLTPSLRVDEEKSGSDDETAENQEVESQETSAEAAFDESDFVFAEENADSGDEGDESEHTEATVADDRDDTDDESQGDEATDDVSEEPVEFHDAEDLNTAETGFASDESTPENTENTQQNDENAAEDELSHGVEVSDDDDRVSEETQDDTSEDNADDQTTLHARAANFEKVVDESPDNWEPDGSTDHENAAMQVAPLRWKDQDEAGKRAESEPESEEVETPAMPSFAFKSHHAAASDADADTRPADVSPEPAKNEFLSAETPLVADEALLDEDALRDMVSEIVRQELQGALGERITRNVRKLVRREIHRALASQELE